MKKALISLGIAMVLLGNAASAHVEKHVKSPHGVNDVKNYHFEESDVFDDPQFGRSSQTY